MAITRAAVGLVWALGCAGTAGPKDSGRGGGADTAAPDSGGSDGADGGGDGGGDGSGDGEDGADDGGGDAGDGGDGADTGDTGPGGEPLPGVGVLGGDCGVLDPAVLTGPSPALYALSLTFDAPWSDADLSPGGQEIRADGNLGGSSLDSEIFAHETLYRCEGAALVATEGEVTYADPSGKKTDLVVDIDGLRIGVSVTRAVGWPQDAPWTTAEATALLEDKLADIPLSSANVTGAHVWEKQVLAVIAFSPAHADALAESWAALSADLRLDTVLWVVATEGDDAFLY